MTYVRREILGWPAGAAFWAASMRPRDYPNPSGLTPREAAGYIGHVSTSRELADAAIDGRPSLKAVSGVGVADRGGGRVQGGSQVPRVLGQGAERRSTCPRARPGPGRSAELGEPGAGVPAH